MCNHPDLFEPRPISSSFIPEPIEFPAYHLVSRVLEKHPLQCLSAPLTSFWALGEDSLTAQLAAERQPPRELYVDNELTEINIPDSVRGNRRLENYALDIENLLFTRRQDTQNFNYSISHFRCTRPRLNISWRTVEAATVPLQMEVISESRFNHRLARPLSTHWTDLLPTPERRLRDLGSIIENFVFVIPPARAPVPSLNAPTHKRVFRGIEPDTEAQIMAAYKTRVDAFYPTRIRQEIFFPDRKLVQFDSGKLQTLAALLHRLKREGHKCLIFTQMSKMLDILEVFLNLHAHTYVRLDGSTGIDRRQKLMDRFNSDPKLFCFILSTRSGGLGINLTGADTVIFYDSDWNPAMDAQAQDRAHRIGQTREVHIYRLVCSSTIEENILTKAQQKKHLDYLVMTEGQFSENSLFSSKGLKDVLEGPGGSLSGGSTPKAAASSADSIAPASTEVRRAEFEAAIAAMEDEEDVSAMRGVKSELAQEQDEFDDSKPVAVNPDDDEPEPGASTSSSAVAIKQETQLSEAVNEERDVDAEFASWQATVGGDFRTLEQALKPVERYALRFREEVENFQSLFALTEQQRLQSVALEAEELDQAWDVDEIEREKELEEQRALAEGELLAANLTRAEKDAHKRWYRKQRRKQAQQQRVRKMTGDAWSFVIDEVTRVPYWYNEDTGEACYGRPKVIAEKEAYAAALERKYNAAPLHVVVTILSYLDPYPDRMNAKLTCALWREAGNSPRLYKRVLPVETGARDALLQGKPMRLEENTFVDLEQALEQSRPGDVIMLGVGHYWGESLTVRNPVMLRGEAGEPSRCVIELSGTFTVDLSASKHPRGAVVVSGVSIQRLQRRQTRETKISGYINIISSPFWVRLFAFYYGFHTLLYI